MRRGGASEGAHAAAAVAAARCYNPPPPPRPSEHGRRSEALVSHLRPPGDGGAAWRRDEWRRPAQQEMVTIRWGAVQELLADAVRAPLGVRQKCSHPTANLLANLQFTWAQGDVRCCPASQVPHPTSPNPACHASPPKVDPASVHCSHRCTGFTEDPGDGGGGLVSVHFNGQPDVRWGEVPQAGGRRYDATGADRTARS
jgi:hypothetical protein